MSNKEIIEVLDEMKEKIRVPEAAITQLRRNTALDEAIKRLKKPRIKVLSYFEAAKMLSTVTARSTYEWLYTFRTLKANNLYICEVDQLNGHWIYDYQINNWKCSRCGQTPQTKGYVGNAQFMQEHFKFCNHCGTRMISAEEGERRNEDQNC